MAENSNISWTHHTFNPWRGCTKVSAGCANCYADTLSKRNPDVMGVWGPSGTRVVAAEAQWKLPVKWNRAAEKAGERHRVFCASLADVFEGRDTMPHGSAHTVEAARLRLFRLIHATPHLDWLLLTKRPHLIRDGIAAALRLVDVYAADAAADMLTDWLGNKPPDNVWLGTSVENQAAADERIPHLLKVPAKVRFLSCEPLLGPVDLERVVWRGRAEAFSAMGINPHLAGEVSNTFKPLDGIHWVIVGGESGGGHRPMEVAWAESLATQCKAAGVSFFMKQAAARLPGQQGRLPLPLWETKEFPA